MLKKLDMGWMLIIALTIIAVVCAVVSGREKLTGFGVTSGLAMNNRTSYCIPGNQQYGGSYAGGCFIPHRVIF